MKIVFLGNFRVDFTTESHWAKEYEALGHEVIRLQETEATTQDLLREGMESDFVHYVHTHGWETPGQPLEEVWELLKKEGIPTVSVHLDIMRGLRRERDVFREAFWKTEYVFTADGGSNDWYRKHGINHFYLPAGVFSGECEIGKVCPDYDHDVVFVGARYGYHREWPYREQLINWLEQTYGDRFALYGRDGITQLRGQELNNLYASAKVVVGDTLCQGFDWPDYFSDRLFETTGRGGCLVFPYIPGLENSFNLVDVNAFLSRIEDDNELATYKFNDFEHLKNTIDLLLERDDFREALRMRGHERTKGEHTYKHRALQMFEVLREQGAIK
jgi:hypothetical protein